MRHRVASKRTLALVVLALAAAAWAVRARADNPPPAPASPGAMSDGTTLLPNGWRLAPAGRHVTVGDLPLNILQTPDSRYLIVTNNGTRKGAPPEAMKIFFTSPGLEDVWQIHFSQLSGQENTVPGMFIANLIDQPQQSMPVAPLPPPPQGQQAPPAPEHNGKAFYVKISAQPDGVFTVTNMRNGFSKKYGSATSGF